MPKLLALFKFCNWPRQMVYFRKLAVWDVEEKDIKGSKRNRRKEAAYIALVEGCILCVSGGSNIVRKGLQLRNRWNAGLGSATLLSNVKWRYCLHSHLCRV